MKIVVVLCLILSACGPESSPEGRMNIKLKRIEKQLDSINSLSGLKNEIDSLKKQNAAISDSIDKINSELKQLKNW